MQEELAATIKEHVSVYTLPAADYANISVELLKVDPFYDQLRNLPRFQKILNTEYKTVY